MKKIVFATGNYNKLKEIRSAVSSFEIIGLLDIKITEELPETGNTLKENALQKANYIYEKTGMDCFSDDTGLEIEALRRASWSLFCKICRKGVQRRKKHVKSLK